MKAQLLPWKRGSCVAWGMDGYKLQGPVLYVPREGAILYKSSIMGDADGMGIVPVSVDLFEYRDFALEILERQIRGEKLEAPHDTEKYDLSQGVQEVDIPEAEFRSIATDARTAYEKLDSFRNQAFSVISNLERKLGHEKLVRN